MEFTGIIIEECGITTGEGQNGPWKMARYVIESIERFPRRIAFDVSDGQTGRIERLGIKQGLRMKIFFDIDARQFEGKWYNSVHVYDARVIAE